MKNWRMIIFLLAMCSMFLLTACRGEKRLIRAEELPQAKRGTILQVPPSGAPAEESVLHEAIRAHKMRQRVEKDLGLEAGSLSKDWQQPYCLRPGDKLTLIISGHEQLSKSYTITKDGKITLPGIGSMEISGLTVRQAERLLQREISKYIRNPMVSVSLVETAPVTVSVIANLPRAGMVRIQPPAGFLQVLSAAGWTPGSTTGEKYMIVRSGRKTILDPHKILELKDLSLIHI